MVQSTFGGPMVKLFVFDGKVVVLLEFFCRFSRVLWLFLSCFMVISSISSESPKAGLGLGNVNLQKAESRLRFRKC